MTTYVLASGVAAVQAVPANSIAPNGSQIVNPSAGQAPTNPQTQTFQVVVTTTAGNGSATVQPYSSNDGANWIAYGAALVVVAAASPAQISGNGAQPWQYYTAIVTAIGGVGAKVAVTMGV